MTRRPDGQLIAFGTVFGLLVLLVCVPVALTILRSFGLSSADASGSIGLESWRLALAEPGIRSSVLNTIVLLAVRTALSFPVAILIAWLLARTDLPGKESLEFLFWLLFFMPPLAITLGWILLLDRSPFDIYSFWGIVWTHLASTAISFKIILLTPLFRNLDAALEEASVVCGATRAQTARLIVLPAMIPSMTLVLVAALLYGFQTFEIELILGTPIRFSVYSTTIYSLLRQEPPLMGAASALSTIVVLLIVPVAMWQRELLVRQGAPTLTGRHMSRLTSLGRWKYPAFVFVATAATLFTIVPLSMLVAGSFMRVMGYFDLSAPWTLAHWQRVLADAFFVRSAANTVALGTSTALISVALCSLVAYLALRSRYRLRYALETLAWLPIGLPGILVGVGLISVFGFPILRPLYGTLVVLVVAGVVVTLALGTQLVKTGLAQIDPALEEASRTAGASRVVTFRRILAPILSPVLMLVAVTSFARAAQDVGSMALLSTASTRPLSLLQIDYITSGQYESATVVATLISAMSIAAALVARTAVSRMREGGTAS